jgi:parallel beta-helix repeat protein
MLRAAAELSVALAMLCAGSAFAQKKIVVPKDYPSIQKAIDEAVEHDTVFVLNGVYKESIMLKDYVAVIGQDADKTVIRGNGSKPVVEGANYATIKNVTVENGGTGILCKNTNPVIEHTIVRDNKKTGIHCLISLPEIKNNLIFGNKWSGIYCELITNAQRTSINHNLIADNGYGGIMLANRSEVLIENNVLLSNKQYGIYVNEDSKRSRIVYNNFFDNRSPFNSYAVINETNIAKDPGLQHGDIASFKGLAGKCASLKGMGKDGVDIGPLTEAVLKNDEIKKAEAMNSAFKDSDNDGIPDSYDQCPNEPEDYDGFQDEDGCPDPDNDKDGIPDVSDKCPNTPEDIDGYLDDDGCPDGGRPAAGPVPKSFKEQPKAAPAAPTKK